MDAGADQGDSRDRIIDACKPFHWRDQYPKVNQSSPEVRKEAKEKWGYLLK